VEEDFYMNGPEAFSNVLLNLVINFSVRILAANSCPRVYSGEDISLYARILKFNY